MPPPLPPLASILPHQVLAQSNRQLASRMIDTSLETESLVRERDAFSAENAQLLDKSKADYQELARRQEQLREANRLHSAVVGELDEARHQFTVRKHQLETAAEASDAKAENSRHQVDVAHVEIRNLKAMVEALQGKQDEVRQRAEEAVLEAAQLAATADRRVGLMQDSLQKAHAYTLHTTLEKTISSNESREQKLRRIIAHLQAEKKALTEKVGGRGEKGEMDGNARCAHS